MNYILVLAATLTWCNATFAQDDWIPVTKPTAYLAELASSNPLFEKHSKVPFFNSEELIISGGAKSAILKTSNGCGIGNFLIPTMGDSSQGIRPQLGTLYDFGTIHYGSFGFLPGSRINGVAFKRTNWESNTSIVATGASNPYIVVTDSGMYSFTFSESFSTWDADILTIDAKPMTGIIKMAKQITTDVTAPIVLFQNDSTGGRSLRFYEYPGLAELFRFPFHFSPEVFEVIDNDLFVSGWDTTGNYTLHHYSTLADTLYRTYSLNAATSNAQEFLKIDDTLYVLSSPGDSIVMLSEIHQATGTLTQSVVYAQSGARATHNEYKEQQRFTFQPKSDTSVLSLNKQILALQPATNQVDTLMLNLKLDYFKYAPPTVGGGFGQFQLAWVGAKWDGNGFDTIYMDQSNIAKLKTGAFPKYINATFGCWFDIPQNEVEKIKFQVSPNPASAQVVIHLSGLEKGRNYELEISDISGKIYHTTLLQAYQEIQLPLHEFPKGVYLLNLNTGKNLISQKLVLQ